MDKMLLNNHQVTVMNLMQEGQVLLSDMGLTDLAGEVDRQARDSASRKAPEIMFYGLYNAGKSTLINALCQKAVAEVGDVPTTAAIQTVPYAGYTLVDTPGINAKEEHTNIAVKEIDHSDLVLFVVDNGDGFERKIVAQAVIEIMRRGKAVAVVINQKNVSDDEDMSLRVSDQPSIRGVYNKVLENLNRQARSEGIPQLEDSKLFLGIFPVNAQMAFDASEAASEDATLLQECSGIQSLVNAMDKSIRSSSAVRMLLTPVTFLREKLKEGLQEYQNSSIFGEQEKYARERQILAESRQRTGDRLKAEGLRKIEAAFEEIQARAADGQSVDSISARLQQELTDLIKSVAAQESELVSVNLKKLELPESSVVDSVVRR